MTALGRRCKDCHVFRLDELYQQRNKKGNVVHVCPENDDGTKWRCEDYSECLYLAGHPEKKIRQRIQKKRDAIEKERQRIEHNNKLKMVSRTPLPPSSSIHACRTLVPPFRRLRSSLYVAISLSALHVFLLCVAAFW